MLLRRYTYYGSSIVTLLTGMRKPLQVVGLFLKPKIPADTQVELRQTGLKFKVRGKMDVWSLKETLLDRFYEQFGFAVQDGWTVVDIGGGIGDYTIFAAYGRPNARVLAFEPFPESFQLLRENLGLNRIENVEIFSQAVSSQERTLQFGSPSNDPLSMQTARSMLASAGDALQVPAVSLASIINGPASGRIDLLKLDCEGAEYDILLNSTPNVLSKIDRIVMEYHDGITPFSHNDLVKYLTEHGYKVDWWKNYAHDHIGYLRAQRIREDQPA
ncbi:MAG: FkbM family methyltransferase [Bellilinea sp.]